MKPRVLVAPLNWGLGHATRCIPVIHSFLEKDWEVILASDGDALALLKKEFPDLPALMLPGYGIRYPFQQVLLNAAFNARNFLAGIREESAFISEWAETEKPDLIISDNRYGVRSDKVKSIYIGHQINLQAGNKALNRLGSYINRKMIRRFDELWIPDQEGKNSLAGDLADEIPGMICKYIGPLSRLEKDDQEIVYDICVVLSGPEPQRSYFQDKLLRQLRQLDEQSVVILGKMDESRDYLVNDMIRVISHATSSQLNELINQSKFIVARAGYSTIMDLVTLDKKAVLIPTPGQPEQSYLARHLQYHPNFIFQKQSRINIPRALDFLAKTNRKGNTGGKFDIEDHLF